jgi:hypothetical protein
MAKTLTQRNVRRNGNLAQGTCSFYVTGGATLAGVDFQFAANDVTGDTLTYIPRFIDKIIVTSSSAVTIDGAVYETGTWDFYDVGGIPTSGPAIVVGAGNVLIKFRS